MSKPAAPASARRDRLKPHTPALVDYTSSVIYGDVWERKDLSKRDRSLVTVAALVACYRPEQLNTHIQRAAGCGWRSQRGDGRRGESYRSRVRCPIPGAHCLRARPRDCRSVERSIDNLLQ